ncbi:MAG TPA: MFS transporter [Chloroflexota bacterium]
MSKQSRAERYEESAEEIGYGRDFRLYITGQAVSLLGDRIAIIALTFLVIRLSRSFAPALGLFYICRVLPTLLGGLVAGVFVDHFSRKHLMVGCDLGRAALLAVVPATSALTLWTLYPLVIALYALTLVFDTAARAALPDVVPENRMMAANAVIQGFETSGDLAYVIGGALIYILSLQAPFYIDAGTFVFSAALVSAMRLPGNPAGSLPSARHVAERIREGTRYLLSNPFLKWSTIALAVAPVAGGAAFVLTPLYADHVLGQGVGITGPFHSGAFRFGVIQGGEAIGALVGSVLAGWLARRWPRGVLFGCGIAGMGVADMLLAFVTNIYTATAILFVSGMFNSLFIISGVTLVQALTPSEMRGRVLAARSTVLNTALALGSAIGGLLLLALSYRALWLLEGAVIVAGSLFVWLRPEVRRQR